MQKKKFYRFKEIAPHGLKTCDVLTEDFHDKWGNLDESAVRLDKTQSLVRLDHTEEEHETIEVAQGIFESYEDRIHTLEIALRAIATGETRDPRFKELNVTELAGEALVISKRFEIMD